MLSLFSMGCDDELTPHDMANHATQQLGVPVFLWGKSDDVCLVRQLKALFDEYQTATPQQREAIGQKLRDQYDAIMIYGSQDVGTVEKISYELHLFRSTCASDGMGGGNQCETRRVAQRGVRDWKQDSDWHSSSGTFPGTRAEKGDELHLKPHKAADRSVHKTYSTFDADLYRNMGSRSYVDIESAHGYGTIRLLSVQKPDPVNCGKLLRFADLMKK